MFCHNRLYIKDGCCNHNFFKKKNKKLFYAKCDHTWVREWTVKAVSLHWKAWFSKLHLKTYGCSVQTWKPSK